MLMAIKIAETRSLSLSVFCFLPLSASISVRRGINFKMQLPHICKMPVLLLVVAVVVIGIAAVVVVVAAASPYPGHMNNYVFALQQPQSMSMSMAMGSKSAFDRKVFIMFRVHSTRSGGSLQMVGAWQGRQGGRQSGRGLCRL